MKLARLARSLVPAVMLSSASCGSRPTPTIANQGVANAQQPVVVDTSHTVMISTEDGVILELPSSRFVFVSAGSQRGTWTHLDAPTYTSATPPWGQTSPSPDTGWTPLDRNDIATSDAPLYRAARRSELATRHPNAKLLASMQVNGGVVVVARIPETKAEGPQLVYAWVDDATVVRWNPVLDDVCPICGRRPPGLVPAYDAQPTAVATWIAAAHHLEAASIVAFERLADELTVLGAPAQLVARVRRAANDERDHARRHRELADERGIALRDPVIDAPPLRDLFAVAIDNAVDGCVYESFGAILATWQSKAARDPRVSALSRVLARDEARHGDLAWAIARWAESRLSPDQRATVAAARHAALRDLPARARTICDVDTESGDALGLPSPDQAAQLAAGFSRVALATA